MSISTDAPFVVFHGDNAQGKTNLLEAVSVLATLKGFRARRNRELIRHGADRALVSGRVDDGESTRRFRVELRSGSRKAEVDGKAPQSLVEYFRGIRAVVFCPEDIGIVRDGPDRRRRFVDRAAFTARESFLDVARDFKRALNQKAALLRQEHPDRIQIEAFNAQLARSGARLSLQRAEIVAELRPHFLELHEAIAGQRGATLRLRSRLGAGDEAELRQAYTRMLEDNLDEELRRGTHVDGPQRDDLAVSVQGRSARAYGSQGQVRSLALSLKLAELLAARARGARPLFLLDDLSSELDRMRRGRLLELLSGLDLQALVTTTDPEVLRDMPEDQRLLYRVRGGAIPTV